jgi:hypothetical protein
MADGKPSSAGAARAGDAGVAAVSSVGGGEFEWA